MGPDIWSKTEKKIARRAFDLAYQRECEAIAEDPASARRLHEMRILLADWMKDTGYPGRGMYMQSRLGGR